MSSRLAAALWKTGCIILSYYAMFIKLFKPVFNHPDHVEIQCYQGKLLAATADSGRNEPGVTGSILKGF